MENNPEFFFGGERQRFLERLNFLFQTISDTLANGSLSEAGWELRESVRKLGTEVSGEIENIESDEAYGVSEDRINEFMARWDRLMEQVQKQDYGNEEVA